MISPGLPAFPLVLGLKTGDSGGNSVGNRLTPLGSRQVSFIHLLLGVRAWARCPASLSLSVHVC